MYFDERRLLLQHRALIADEVRTNAFAAAIARSVREDDVVLDLGAGTGVLAMLAARAGARRVFAVEQGHVGDIAATLFDANRCNVEIVHGRSSEIDLPERATLLVTETLGNLGFDEQILESVLDARRRLLTPGARIIPSRVALFAAPADGADLFEREVAFWGERRYGIDFSPVRTFAANQVRAAAVDDLALLAPGKRIVEVDLASASSADVRGAARFAAARDGAMHGFAAWFEATLAEEIRVGNGPSDGTTNWRQAFLPLDEPARVRAGDEIEVEIDSADGLNWRWRGAVAGRSFEQTTHFGFAPCRVT